MNTVSALIMGTAGIVSGWFIPLMATKVAAYKCEKKGKPLPPAQGFMSPLLKLACLLVNGACWAVIGMFTENLIYAVLLGIILLDAAVITIVDIRINIIPNEAVLIMLLVGLLVQILFHGFPSIVVAVLTMLIVMAVFTTLGSFLGLNSVGAGDVKLAGAMGLTLSYPHIMYGLVGMSALMLVWCLGGLATRKLSLKSMFAFAPFMMAGTALAIFAIVFGY